MSRPRLHAAIVATGVAALLAGCGADGEPLGTQIAYDPSDGIGAQVGDLSLRNLLIASEGEGEPGVLSGALVNTGQEEVELTLALSDSATQDEPQDPFAGDPTDTATSVVIDVPAGAFISIGPDSDVFFQLDAVDVATGDLLDMTASSPAEGDISLAVPVLLPVREYATLTPSPEPTGTPEPFVTSTGTATPSSATSTDEATATDAESTD